MTPPSPDTFAPLARRLLGLLAAWFLLAGAAWAQAGNTDAFNQADRRAEQALAAADAQESQEGADAALPVSTPRINVLELAMRGGPLMYPILLISVLVVGCAVERAIGLRRRNIMPRQLVRELGKLATAEGGLDPRQAYKVCQQFPSSASTVVREVLLKIGRPHAEVERTVTDSCQREATRLYRNVRKLELAAAVTPLLGLLGTVQGMIMAFFQTANTTGGVKMAESLAAGIYTALVTTFAGLCVAIPAAVLAHHFEGRIQTLLGEVEEFMLKLLPQWERYEGKLRVNRHAVGETARRPETTSVTDS